MPLDRSRRSFIVNGALTSAIVLAGQAIGWPEAAIAQGVGKETRSNFIDIQRHENDHVNFLVGALGGSARPKLVALTGWGKDEDRHRSDDAGFDAHVVKAVDVAKLLADVGAARQGLRC
jgi:hypothetical protein